MKTIALLLTVLLITFSFPIQAAQTAQAHLFCLSLRFHQGENSFGDTLGLTSISSPLNGELFPTTGGTYASNFEMDLSGFPINGALQVNMPNLPDANGNGFDDFFEVSQGVGSTTTSGNYTTPISHGTITAQWSRSAGSPNGRCVLNFKDSSFGDLGDFIHAFEVLEYTGPLTYAPGNSNVTASVNLTQTGNPANTLQGPVLFSKTIPGDFDYLVLRAGDWTNAAAQTLSFLEHDFLRDLFLLTNYYGLVEFADGDPSTAGYDYPFWTLSIDDVNDADADTIPDFSDTPSGSTPRRPLLSLARGTTNLWLTISGDMGRLHHILENTNLATGNWQTNLSLTLTNDPQTISLPLPTVAAKFWRAIVP